MEIQEKFVTFLDLEQLTGEHNARKLTEFHEQSGINSKQPKGRCYDDASNIRSEKNGLLVLSSKNQKML